MEIKKQLGINIKKLRLEKSYTQEYLAEISGISPKSLSQIEIGNNFISAETLEAICKALDVKPNKLFQFENSYASENMLSEINNRLEKNNSLLKTIYKIIIALDD